MGKKNEETAEAAAAPERKKTECPLTREEFRKAAQAMQITIGGKLMTANVKEFSTGSLGWFFNDKFSIEVGGKVVRIQPSCSFVIVGSKELPQ